MLTFAGRPDIVEATGFVAKIIITRADMSLPTVVGAEAGRVGNTYLFRLVVTDCDTVAVGAALAAVCNGVTQQVIGAEFSLATSFRTRPVLEKEREILATFQNIVQLHLNTHC